MDNLPEGVTSLEIPAGAYREYTAIGKIPEVVAQVWEAIWQSDLPRAYRVDFDLYDGKNSDPSGMLVKTYISVK